MVWDQELWRADGTAFPEDCFPPPEIGCLRPWPQLCAPEWPLHMRPHIAQFEGMYASFSHAAPPLQWAKGVPLVMDRRFQLRTELWGRSGFPAGGGGRVSRGTARKSELRVGFSSVPTREGSHDDVSESGGTSPTGIGAVRAWYAQSAESWGSVSVPDGRPSVDASALSESWVGRGSVMRWPDDWSAATAARASARAELWSSAPRWRV